MEQGIKYPVGLQSFAEVRGTGAVYVDKTDLVYRLATGTKYNFLSRPRRFGKSLLVSTLEAYFLGQKELFAGLAMEGLERDWVKYPVLHLDFSQNNFTSEGTLSTELNLVLGQWEKIYGRDELECDFSQRFRGVISRAHALTGRQAVVLVDEYDKPLLDAIDNEALLARNQDALRGFYGVLKGMDAHLQFVFLTGVTRFAHLSLFSGLNNLEDISLDAQYAALCGFTAGELQANFGEGVRQLAEKQGQTVGEAYGKLKAMYDGYRFSPDVQAGVYNPFSLLMALEKGVYGRYWYESGTPQFLFKLMVQDRVRVAELGSYPMDESDLAARGVAELGAAAALYQTGYLTIESYADGLYTMRLPNGEVEEAFFKGLLRYLFPRNGRAVVSIRTFTGQIQAGQAAELMAGLHAFLAWGDYRVAGEAELYFQNVMLIIFKLLGQDARAEYATSDGRIDLVVETIRFIYLFEFKLDKSAEEAMAQIEEKGYAAPFALGRQAVVKLGVNFSSKTRNIAGCIIRAEGQADVRMAVQAGKLSAVKG